MQVLHNKKNRPPVVECQILIRVGNNTIYRCLEEVAKAMPLLDFSIKVYT
jgi:hypothetical protein